MPQVNGAQRTGLWSRLERLPLRKMVMGTWLNSYSRYWDFLAVTEGNALKGVQRGRLSAAPVSEEEIEATGKEDAALILPWCRPNAKVLDFGCGVGRIAKHVAPASGRMVCADISTGMLRRARRRLQAFSNVEFVRVGRRRLGDLSATRFDVIYSIGVLHHIHKEDIIWLLREFRQLLNPGGAMVINVPNLLDPQKLDNFVNYSLRFGAEGIARQRYFTGQEMEAICSKLGFNVGSVDEGEFVTVVAHPSVSQAEAAA